MGDRRRMSGRPVAADPADADRRPAIAGEVTLVALRASRVIGAVILIPSLLLAGAARRFAERSGTLGSLERRPNIGSRLAHARRSPDARPRSRQSSARRSVCRSPSQTTPERGLCWASSCSSPPWRPARRLRRAPGQRSGRPTTADIREGDAAGRTAFEALAPRCGLGAISTSRRPPHAGTDRPRGPTCWRSSRPSGARSRGCAGRPLRSPCLRPAPPRD
jgi:hypothetical protein